VLSTRGQDREKANPLLGKQREKSPKILKKTCKNPENFQVLTS
jgi:hypothetical protein